MTTGIPINPNYFTGLLYNSSFYNTSGGLTLAEASTKFLAFPIAQGAETLSSVIVADTLTTSKNIIMNGATGITGNYLQFPDGSQQSTAFVGANYARINTDNAFLNPYIQTFSNGLSSNGSLIIGTPQTGAYQSTLSVGTSNNTLNVNSNIQSTGNISTGASSILQCGSLYATSGTINGSTIATNATLSAYPTLAGVNNFTGTNTISGSAIVTQPTLSQYASLAGTNNFLGTNTILNSPIVTQATLPSLSGYASITGTNTFTGVNTFSQLVNIPAQIYNPASTYGNSSATQSFVQQAVLDGTSTQLISVGVSDTTGFSATSFTFTQVLNTKQQTNNYYMTAYADNNFTIGSPINFTLTFPSFLYPTGSTPNTLNAAGGSNTNVYCDSTGQSFNCGMSFLNNTQIRCSSGGTTTGGAKDYSISATFIIIWT